MIGSTKKRRSLTNLVSLAIIQISNAATPLLAYPLVLAAVGSSAYADIVVAEAASAFLLAFVLYSFDIDGVVAAIGRGVDPDRAKLSQIFSQIMVLRCVFYVAGVALLSGIFLVIHPEMLGLMLGWSLVSLSYALQPNWLYQAMEYNQPAAVATAISRGGAILTLIVVVQQPQQSTLVPMIIGGWYVIGAIGAGMYAIRYFNLRVSLPPLHDLVKLTRHGKEIFLGNLGVGLYRDVNVLLLRALGAADVVIAAYSIAEKLVKGLQASIRPLNQLYLPRAIAIAAEKLVPSPSAFFALGTLTIRQLVAVAFVLVLAFSSALIFGPTVAARVGLDNFHDVLGLSLIMSVGIFPGVANFVMGSCGLNTLGARSYLLRCIVVVGLVSVAVNVALVPQIGAVGAALAFVLAETVLFVMVALRYFRPNGA